MEPQITIPLSEYNKLLKRPFFDVEKENILLKKWLINTLLPPHHMNSKLSIDNFMMKEKVSIVIQYDDESRLMSQVERVKITFK